MNSFGEFTIVKINNIRESFVLDLKLFIEHTNYNK